MQIELNIDPQCQAPRIIIEAPALTDEVSAILQKLSKEAPLLLTGFRDDTPEVLEPVDILRLYASSGKVYATTSRGDYALRLRLYELEQRLDPRQFVRISNSEIINLKMIESLDLSLSGTICVKLRGGLCAYASRRYLSRLKKILGISR